MKSSAELQARCQLNFDCNSDGLDFVYLEKSVIALEDKGNTETIHSRLPNECISKIRMEYESDKGAYQSYNSYARRVGFSTKRSKSHLDPTGKILNRIFLLFL